MRVFDHGTDGLFTIFFSFGSYKRFIEGTKKNLSINWTEVTEEVFIEIEEPLSSAPILSQQDYSKEFTIQCDASAVGLGGILTQVIKGEEKVIAYASRSFLRADRIYLSI